MKNIFEPSFWSIEANQPLLSCLSVAMLLLAVSILGLAIKEGGAQVEVTPSQPNERTEKFSSLQEARGGSQELNTNVLSLAGAAALWSSRQVVEADNAYPQKDRSENFSAIQSLGFTDTEEVQLRKMQEGIKRFSNRTNTHLVGQKVAEQAPSKSPLPNRLDLVMPSDDPSLHRITRVTRAGFMSPHPLISPVLAPPSHQGRYERAAQLIGLPPMLMLYRVFSQEQ